MICISYENAVQFSGSNLSVEDSLNLLHDRLTAIKKFSIFWIGVPVFCSLI
jgi:hypothetical protein